MSEMPPLVLVFCGARDGASKDYAEQAAVLGQSIASAGWGLVYGGGTVGTMGAVACAVKDSGLPVVGVLPRALAPISNEVIPGTIMVEDMFDRKKKMLKMCSAVVCLPGGFGTFDELFEALTLYQLGCFHRPIILLNIKDFFKPFLALVDHMIEQGFAEPKVRNFFLVVETPVEAIRQCAGLFMPEPGAALDWGQNLL